MQCKIYPHTGWTVDISWSETAKMSKTTGLSKSKSISIMLVVIACFSVLWPKIFYPMIMCGLNWSTDQAERAREFTDVHFEVNIITMFPLQITTECCLRRWEMPWGQIQAERPLKLKGFQGGYCCRTVLCIIYIFRWFTYSPSSTPDTGLGVRLPKEPLPVRWWIWCCPCSPS